MIPIGANAAFLQQFGCLHLNAAAPAARRIHHRAALDGRRKAITPAMKIAAARAISSLAGPDELVPSPLHPEVHTAVIAAATEAFKREEAKAK